MQLNKIYNMDCIEGMKQLPGNSIHCCVTSPPYWGKRDYGEDGQLGLEPTLQEYIVKMVDVFREVKRVLRDDGTAWLNMGDTYAGSNKGAWLNKTAQKDEYVPNPGDKLTKCKSELKPKNLIGIPWRIALALQDDGWYLRQDIIWHKSNAMPESANDRCTNAHEYIFLLSKSDKYYFDYETIMEDCVNGDPNPPRGSKGVLGNQHKGNRKTFRGSGVYTKGQSFNNSADIKSETKGNKPNILQKRRKRSVWTVATRGIKDAHFATYPRELIRPCILAGAPKGGIVLDPFMGSGTTAVEAFHQERQFIGFDINKNYCDMAINRLRQQKNQVTIE